MTKYKINLADLEKSGNIEKLYRDGHSKKDVLQAIHNMTDQHSYSHKDRTEQRLIVENLFDTTKNQP